MKAEEQRIAIATACGWTGWGGFATKKPWKSPSGESFESPPDYLNDLNAMHEAEKFMPVGYRGAYTCNLWSTMGHAEPPSAGYLDAFYISRATASQRAEAFLKTLNLWTE